MWSWFQCDHRRTIFCGDDPATAVRLSQLGLWPQNHSSPHNVSIKLAADQNGFRDVCIARSCSRSLFSW
eukprot:1996307-Pleurochrysis_carterae.AAC.1